MNIKMKGISLSINVIIVLVVGLIVLLALLVMFMSSVTPGGDTMKCQSKWNAACANYVAAGGCDDETVSKSDLESAASCMNIGNPRDVCCHITTTTT